MLPITAHHLRDHHNRTGTPVDYQSTEYLLYGSIHSDKLDQLLQLLQGLCDPGGSTKFQEHDMCFKLKTKEEHGQTVQVHARRRFKFDSYFWHFRYIGMPETSTTDVIVRKTLNSLVYSNNMMDFVKSLGLRMEYEYIADGSVFTKGNIRILVYRVVYTETTGNYTKLKDLSDSYLVEASIMLQEKQPHNTAAKELKEFAPQLLPLCKLENIKYLD